MKKSALVFTIVLCITIGVLNGCKQKNNSLLDERNKTGKGQDDLQLQNQTKTPNHTIDIEELAWNLKEDVPFQDELSELEDGMFEFLYEDIDESFIDKKVIYVSTGATAEEIAVIKVTNKENIKEIEKGLESRVKMQRESFETYLPEEMQKLEDPIIETIGTVVVLCISNDNDAAKLVLSNYIE